MNKLLLIISLFCITALSYAEEAKVPDILVENYKIVPVSSATKISVPVFMQAKNRNGKIGQYYKIVKIVVSKEMARKVIYCYDNAKDDSLVCDYTLERVRLRNKPYPVGKFFLLKEEYKKSYRSS